MSRSWSRDEVEFIVADYFAMLRAELSGETVNKADHNRRLRRQLDSRSKGSIEFKHANITAALLNLGDLPTIDGYKPRYNYQQLLEQVILERLSVEPDFFERLAAGPVVRPEATEGPDTIDIDALEEPPPETSWVPGIHDRPRQPAARPGPVRRIDFARIDAENRALGRRGEELVLEFERRRLHDRDGRGDLAERIVWVSQEEGDGAGYDIRSFNRDASPRLIEVKTTGLTKYHPFYVSPNELAVSEREERRYFLYRVFRFGRGPRLYTLHGALSAVCHLEPSQYQARVAR
jgi:hypothetical protein